MKTIKMMKKMKRPIISVFSLLLIGGVGVTSAYAAKLKLAVLVVGLETDAASNTFATGIEYEVNQKGVYELVSAASNTAVKAKLTTLRQQHKDGVKVDTAGLAAWGRENGLDFVQLVVESDCSITIGNSAPISGREQVAQVVRCGATKYSGREYYRTRFVPQEEMLEEMVFVAGGVFQMGCVSGGRDGTCGPYTETPVHYVKVNNFYIGKYEVTQALWKKVMGSLPSSILGTSYTGDDKPVVFVSWNDIAGSGGFLEKLNQQTGRNYRLPTEAEWEYAARGCNAGACESLLYSGSNNVEDVAWYQYNCSYPQPVGTKLPNALGLYDMSGNVFEWCSDWYLSTYYPSGTTASSPQNNPTGPSSGTYRCIRSDCFYNGTSYPRVARRNYSSPTNADRGFGFRLVLQ
jgi:formylglycine-generating enzyme required for sulfatase activity